ncbi:hypothetical protein TNCV_3237561 [Trichonephila clavipes]|nr:hypothetical protein TNCV_3237561 [Trichonephila clavipes]
MSRSSPVWMPFGVQPLSGSTIAICGPVRQNHICFLCVRVLCHRTASLCAMEISFSGLLLIVLSLWRLIQLLTVKFAYSAFNTFSLKFRREPPARFIHCHDTCNSWGTYEAFDAALTASGRHFRPPFLCYSSRLGVLYLVGGRVHP